jgi:VWFA-related protein
MRRNAFLKMLSGAAFIVFGLTLAQAAQGDPQLRQSQDPESPIVPRVLDVPLVTADINLVQLPLSVVDKNGRLIEGLDRGSFQVFEDNVAQDITQFSQDDAPISMGLVIDNSLSMKRKRERVNAAALSFVKARNRGDETFIVSFNDEAFLDQDFTTEIADLRDALDNIDSMGGTAVYDAVFLAVDHMAKGKHDRRALLVITDGEDASETTPGAGSKYGFNKVIEHVKAAKNVTVYAIGILEDGDDRGGLFRKSPSDIAKDRLKKITETTGGQAFFPKSVNDVEDMCALIAKELRAQYTIGYSPKNAATDGKWRAVRVAVTPPKGASKLEVRAKPGYYARGGSESDSPEASR